MQPFERAPVGIPDFEEAQREQCRERKHDGNRSENAARSGGQRLRVRPVLPAQPEKIRSEKWDEPAVVVLLADRPLVAQMPEKDKPKGADGGNSQRGASEIAAAFDGDGLSLRKR